MAITGDPISAEEAAALGLVTRLAEPGRAVETAMRLASRIARNAPLAVAASKRMVHATQTQSEAGLWEVQEPLRALVFGSNDAKEGPRAFAEKRDPVWTAT
jgi:enoyl-CoA hydratase